MGSLRNIRGESLAEQNRIRSLIKKGAALSRVTEEKFEWIINRVIRESQPRLPTALGKTSSKELILKVICGLWEGHHESARELGELFDLPDHRFSESHFLYPNEMLARVKEFGCVGCEWLKKGICTQSDGEDALPAECPGFAA